MTRSRGFGSLTFITSETFNVHPVMWVMISCLQCSMHTVRARVSKHGVKPMNGRPNHGVGEGKFPLCVAVVTNNFFVIKYFSEVSVWKFLLS